MKIRALILILLVASAGHLFAQKDKSFGRPNIPGKLILDLGSYGLTNASKEFESRWFGSKSVGLSYTREKDLTKNLTLNIGIGITSEKISFKSNEVLRVLPQFGDSIIYTNTASDTTSQSLDKNKLALTFLEIPVEFRFYPLGTDHKTKWFIGVGGYAGFNFNTHSKYKIRRGETVKQQADFGQNRFRYGLMLRFGFDSFSLFGRVGLSEVFDTDNQFYQGQAMRSWTAGISMNIF